MNDQALCQALWAVIQKAYKELGVHENGILLSIREDGSGTVTDVRSKEILYDFDSLSEFISRFGIAILVPTSKN